MTNEAARWGVGKVVAADNDSARKLADCKVAFEHVEHLLLYPVCCFQLGEVAASANMHLAAHPLHQAALQLFLAAAAAGILSFLCAFVHVILACACQFEALLHRCILLRPQQLLHLTAQMLPCAAALGLQRYFHYPFPSWAGVFGLLELMGQFAWLCFVVVGFQLA